MVVIRFIRGDFPLRPSRKELHNVVSIPEQWPNGLCYLSDMALVCDTDIKWSDDVFPVSNQVVQGRQDIWLYIVNHSTCFGITHDDVIKWKHFPRYWPFVRGIHRSPVNSRHKEKWRGALMFSLICALNKRLSKQSWGWWFETPSHSIWRHCNALTSLLAGQMAVTVATVS